MIQNFIAFAKLNPWTMGFTVLTLFVFVIVLFLVNGKNGLPKDAKLTKEGLNFFMVMMIGVICVLLFIFGYSPDIATALDSQSDLCLIYWLAIGLSWTAVKLVTGIDPEEIIA